MGCGASVPAVAVAATEPAKQLVAAAAATLQDGQAQEPSTGPTHDAPGQAGEVRHADTFNDDLSALVSKLLLDPGYAPQLYESLQASSGQGNQAEVLLKLILSLAQAVGGTTQPRHTLPEFLAGVAVYVLHHLGMSHSPPRELLALEELQGGRGTAYHRDAKWAHAVYRREADPDPRGALVASMALEPLPFSVPPEAVVYLRPDSQLARPALAVALDPGRALVMVVVRGTGLGDIKDLLTDAGGNPVPWGEGYAHEGIAMAARALYQEVSGLVMEQLRAQPPLAVRTVGHSIGGAVAALLALTMQRDSDFLDALYGGQPAPEPGAPGCKLSCVCFGAAACLSRELAEEAEPLVTTVLHSYDWVPRTSPYALTNIVLFADLIADAFEGIRGEVRQLLDGAVPPGWDAARAAELAARAAASPVGVVEELIGERVWSGPTGADGAPSAPPRYLLGPVSARERVLDLMLKQTMFDDHSMSHYVFGLCTGAGAPPSARALPEWDGQGAKWHF
ncbi:hypothetical protein HYH03_014791 [Edaphochlamys debaryana]|uniref:Fungal lipase-type domain-containing protein n=1 Tax=Edaphochlamys debaryana TaxID=47281 RepID=A0A835XPC3_9CHLO|nr:hypothetical protein HYH03_014791 [Edaphochlamys debaryana]|eukprot:KAG2486488.1 hypothetical protein HYH03_014791 [Edaphochlamys debaryana]